MKVKWINAKECNPTEEKYYLTVIDGDIAGSDDPFITLSLYENGKWDEGEILYWFDKDTLEDSDNWKLLKNDGLPKENKCYLVKEIYDFDKPSRSQTITISHFINGKWDEEYGDEIISWMEYPEMPAYTSNNKKEKILRFVPDYTISGSLAEHTVILPESLKEDVNKSIIICRYPVSGYCNLITVSNIYFAKLKNNNTMIISDDIPKLIGVDDMLSTIHVLFK